jgi:hypothetical protein
MSRHVPNARQLLELHRVRRRDRLAWDYGTYWLSEIDGNTVRLATFQKSTPSW